MLNINRNYWIVLFSALCVLGAFFYLKVNEASSIYITKDDAKVIPALNPHAEESIHTSADENKTRIKNVKTYGKADAAEFASWMSNRGHFSKEERQDYASYDKGTLELLANSGDLKALDTLADFYMKAGDLKNSAIYFEKSATYGSTYAIEILGILSYPNPSMTPEEGKLAALETLSLLKVMAMRGDNERSIIESDTVLKTYGRFFNKNLNIAPEDQEKIDARAVVIYNDWQQKRAEMGLGNFDNSQPSGVKKFFEFIKSGMASSN